ncbi:MAG TPA: SulP family inorganic anion transporter [Burkholderiales bacterium]|nr:SulP family inorganic anion transporter [Burkholderiales bacterium]
MSARVRSDVTGGLVSAAVAIPLAMGYGMFAFVALGPQYFVHGAFAGLVTAAVAGLGCIALGDRSTHIYAPRVITTFFLGLLLYGLLRSDAPAMRNAGMAVALPVLFSIILLGGVFQALFGLARLGSVIKLIPQPVMSGFQNAAALILFLVQIGNVFGFDDSPSFLQALAHVKEARPLSVLVAAVAAGTMWKSRSFLPKVPPLLVGLAAGTVLYYALRLAGLGGHLGTTLGVVAFGVQLPSVPHFTELARTPGMAALVPTIVGGALALAIVASIDALLCTKILANPGDRKIDGDRLLMRLGTANVLSAGLGGITAGLNIGPSQANKAFGGHTPLSVAVNAGTLLVLLVFLFPVLSALPRAALSGVIMVIAIQHFDPWTVRLARRVAKGGAGRNMLLDLLVIALVAVLSLAVDIVLAVLLGIAIAALLFVVRMSRSVIRRQYRCSAMRSRKQRPRADIGALAQSGSKILALELQGALFFGSAERVAGEIAAQIREPTCTVILDLRRITEVDSTGARILLEINTELNRAGKWLVLSATHKGDAVGQQLEESGVLAEIGADNVFLDLDRAIEWAEDELLRSEGAAAASQAEVPFAETCVVEGLSRDEVAAVEKHIKRVAYEQGRVIFREGDQANEFFIVAKGSASAQLRPQGGGDIRLMSFAQGTVFGELAFLDAGPRSATVTSDTELVCYVLSDKDLASLAERAPALTIKLVTNLARELGVRLRDANRTIQILEA